ncbi:MAG TPA: TetR/AcrR family transcriptional regulator [Candidatus Binatia bacterium]|nr:TetR/AcrR family transcriptional regulator [Candidatus Binatia bacterium]
MSTPTALPPTPRGEATRRKLLNAAEKEFAEKGFHGASVSHITQRADVGQGTFYLYFRSKEEIFTTLVRDIGHQLRAHSASRVTGAKDRLEAERLGLEAFLDFASRHPGLYRIVQESQFVDETVFREYYEKLAEGYAAGLDRASRKGELRPGHAEARAWALMGIGHFIGQRWCLWKQQAPPPEVLDEVMQLLRHGLEPRK